MDRRSTRHRLTRLGVQVMLIGVFGILGGSLNGLNLLIVVAGIILGTLVAQWRLSRAIIDSLRMDRRLPVEAFAGKPVRIRYQVNNEHPLLPVWLVKIEDNLKRLRSEAELEAVHSGKGRVFQLPSQDETTDERENELSARERWAKRLDGKRLIAWLDGRFTRPSKPDTNDHLETFTAVGLLMPNQTTSAFFDVTIAQRGRYRLGRWHVSTTAPFTLSTAWRESIREEDVLDVYPRLLPLTRSWRRNLPSRVGGVSASAQRQGTSDDVFFGLREYRHGDSPRHIHWRTTARLGSPAVRQFEQQRRYDLCILVDGFAGPDPTLVEKAISLAATIAVRLSGDPGSHLLLVVAGQEIEIIGGVRSPHGLKRMLRSLARMQLSQNIQMEQALLDASQIAKHLPDLVVISSRSQKNASKNNVSIANAIRRWNSRSQVRWVDVGDRDIKRWVSSPKPSTGQTKTSEEPVR